MFDEFFSTTGVSVELSFGIMSSSCSSETSVTFAGGLLIAVSFAAGLKLSVRTDVTLVGSGLFDCWYFPDFSF